MFVLRTNTHAREKVSLDLKILKLLEKRGQLTREELSKQFGVSLKKIDGAIERINILGKLRGVAHR